jgi:hypothetical protein
MKPARRKIVKGRLDPFLDIPQSLLVDGCFHFVFIKELRKKQTETRRRCVAEPVLRFPAPL